VVGVRRSVDRLESRRREGIAFHVAVTTEGVEVDGPKDGFVRAAVGVGGVVGDETALVGFDPVGTLADFGDDDQAVPRLAVPDEGARSVVVGGTERGAPERRRDERPPATDRTDGGPPAGRRDEPFGHFEGDTAQVLAPGVTKLMVRTGTGVGVEVDDVRPAVGLDGVPAVTKRPDGHRLDAGATGAPRRALGGEGGLRAGCWQ